MLVLRAGSAGLEAAQAGLGLGARLTFVEKNPERFALLRALGAALAAINGADREINGKAQRSFAPLLRPYQLSFDQ